MAKYLLTALALTGSVLGQSKTVCDGPSVTITSDADAASIATCGIYNGDVIIDASASGTININGVQQINGNLQCRNATGLTAINAGVLSTISKSFDLQSLTTLSTLNMPYLRRVATINWIALPQLQGLNFATGIQESNDVLISNTQLNTLQGIELTQVGSIDINNNPYLTDINVNGLTNITKALSFSANNMALDVNFPNLLNAGNLTFRNVSSVSVPSLSSVAGSIGMYSDYFQNFSAPNLSTIGQALAFIDCSQLNTFSFPQLTLVGGAFIVINNTNLKSIQGIPKLLTIGGAIDFIGTFDSVTASFKDVRGGAEIITSSQNSSLCTAFTNAQKNSVIKGSLTCKVNTVTGQTNGSSNGSSSGSHNAAPSLNAPSVIPFTGLLGFIAYMLL